jgi:hypothetical protein
MTLNNPVYGTDFVTEVVAVVVDNVASFACNCNRTFAVSNGIEHISPQLAAKPLNNIKCGNGIGFTFISVFTPPMIDD